MEIRIVIYGEPVPQGRPRFARQGNYVKTYDPQKSKNYKQLARFWITQHLKKTDGFRTLQNALYCEITFYLPIPISWSKKKRMEASEGVIRPTVRGDIDNYIKCILDAGLGIVWADDSIITDICAKKRYTADVSRTEIIVKEVE